MTTVYLVRHSEKMQPAKNMWQVFDRIQPLSVRGEEKAKALLELECLRNADAAYCSPFARTLSTLRYIMEADGLRPALHEGLKELEFGENPFPGGMPPMDQKPGKPPEMPKDDPRAKQWRDRDLALGGGESINQCCSRMADAIGSILREHPDKKILVGSHGAAISAYLTGLNPELGEDFIRSVAMPDVFRLTFQGETFLSMERIELPEGAR